MLVNRAARVTDAAGVSKAWGSAWTGGGPTRRPRSALDVLNAGVSYTGAATRDITHEISDVWAVASGVKRLERPKWSGLTRSGRSVAAEKAARGNGWLSRSAALKLVAEAVDHADT